MQTDVQRGAGAKIPLSQFLRAMGFAQELFVFVFAAAQRCAPLHVAVRRSVVGSSPVQAAVRSLDRLCVPVPGIFFFFFFFWAIESARIGCRQLDSIVYFAKK